MRTIEDVQADIQAKKKMKLSQTVTSVEPNPNLSGEKPMNSNDSN